MEVRGQLHVSAALPKRKSPRYPLYRRLGGPQSRSGRYGEEKNSQPLPELEPLINQPVVQNYTTELSGLLRWEGIMNKLPKFDVYCALRIPSLILIT
jgi:hypothetical protein